jgi:hypothetical protein
MSQYVIRSRKRLEISDQRVSTILGPSPKPDGLTLIRWLIQFAAVGSVHLKQVPR